MYKKYIITSIGFMDLLFLYFLMDLIKLYIPITSGIKQINLANHIINSIISPDFLHTSLM